MVGSAGIGGRLGGGLGGGLGGRRAYLRLVLELRGPVADQGQQQRDHGAAEVDRRLHGGVRGATGGAGPHRHGLLGDPAARACRDHEGLHGVTEVLGRVVLGEERDRPSVGDTEPRGDVGEPGPRQAREHPGEQHHGPAARAADHVGVVRLGEAGADHHVGAVQPVDEVGQEAGIVLPVGVDLHGHVVAVAQGVAVAGPHGTAHAEVERQPAHGGPGRRRHLGRAVGGAVVDDQQVRPRDARVDLPQGLGDARLLVPCGHDDENPETVRSCRHPRDATKRTVSVLGPSGLAHHQRQAPRDDTEREEGVAQPRARPADEKGGRQQRPWQERVRVAAR